MQVLAARCYCSPLLRAQGRRRSATVAQVVPSKPYIVLGIESSCDDTGAAVVSSDGKILGEALASQEEIHKPWGGVVPKLAQEAHAAAIDRVVEEALTNANVKASELDGVAVTVGPGLSLCLRIGVLKARQVASINSVKLINCHHMEAHALVARLGKEQSLQFPFVCLLISGGHNLLLLVRGVGDYMQIGTTLDDAIGEAYDKVARMLGLELSPSGGAALEVFAKEGNPNAFPFTMPLRHKKTCDFSYSGLKTAVRLAIEAEVGEDFGDATRQVRADIAASFQQVAVQQLANRVALGIQWIVDVEPGVTSLVVAGGVAANQQVRRTLDGIAAKANLRAEYPPVRLCTDNGVLGAANASMPLVFGTRIFCAAVLAVVGCVAATAHLKGVMVAWAGIERLRLGLSDDPPATAEPGEGEWIDLRPRWPLTHLQHPNSVAPKKRRRGKNGTPKPQHESLTLLTQASLANSAVQVVR